ncbi:MAG: hypothetical protein JWM68_4196 [Verrucomicrobiales bacterium]|nr:hypothetical protein [Verrucomicrobiales bacterium]
MEPSVCRRRLDFYRAPNIFPASEKTGITYVQAGMKIPCPFRTKRIGEFSARHFVSGYHPAVASRRNTDRLLTVLASAPKVRWKVARYQVSGINAQRVTRPEGTREIGRCLVENVPFAKEERRSFALFRDLVGVQPLGRPLLSDHVKNPRTVPFFRRKARRLSQTL